MYYDTINIWDHFNGNIKDKAVLEVYVPEQTSEIPFVRKRSSVLICPGGGYAYASRREAEPVALAFAGRGFNTFVLTYGTAPEFRHPQPLLDVSRAMCIIRENAEKWYMDKDKIAVCGFSAGAHLAASLGVFWKEAYIQDSLKIPEGLNKPNALILGYPVLTSVPGKAHMGSFYNLLGENLEESAYAAMSLENHVNGNTPPAFIWHTFDDKAVPVDSSLLFAQSMKNNNIPFELHIFPEGEHGLSMCDERTAASDSQMNEYTGKWFDMCVGWLKKFAFRQGTIQ